MKGAIIFSWGTPVRGREAKSLEVFGKALQYYEDLAKLGRVDAQRVFISNTGNLAKWAGMLIVEGDLGELHKLMTEEDFVRLQVEAGQIVENLTVEIATGGVPDDIQDPIRIFGEVTAALGS